MAGNEISGHTEISIWVDSLPHRLCHTVSPYFLSSSHFSSFPINRLVTLCSDISIAEYFLSSLNDALQLHARQIQMFNVAGMSYRMLSKIISIWKYGFLLKYSISLSSLQQSYFLICHNENYWSEDNTSFCMYSKQGVNGKKWANGVYMCLKQVKVRMAQNEVCCFVPQWLQWVLWYPCFGLTDHGYR